MTQSPIDKQLRAAIKAMAQHQLAIADGVEVLLLKAMKKEDASELSGHSEEFESLMENLTYD